MPSSPSPRRVARTSSPTSPNSLTVATLAVALAFTGARDAVQLVASLLVLLWALRLGGYLFRRILRMKVDHRFDACGDKPLRFARFWLLQAP